MSDPLTVASIAAGSAILSTLLTISLMPRLQHYFWTYQRMAELRLVTINEVNKLMAEFITNHIVANGNYRPTPDYFRLLAAAAAQVKAQFLDTTFQFFKRIEVMIPGLDPEKGKQTVEDFIEARDVALRALYKEAGLFPKSGLF